MLGRTYSIGYEPDLNERCSSARAHRAQPGVDVGGLVSAAPQRPVRAACRADEQRVILAEHGAIGMSFGAGDYAHDIRLACHGLDKDDNDFVVGLIGKDLFPLSAIVQAMRKTQQTSLYLERLGPFFVGRASGRASDLRPFDPLRVVPSVVEGRLPFVYRRRERRAACGVSSPARTRRRA